MSTDPYRGTRRDARLTIIAEALHGLIPGAAPAALTIRAEETVAGVGRHSWEGSPRAVAERVFTALYGRPDKPEPTGPLAQATDAKRARDLAGELGSLMAGDHALRTAPWYPARAGDILHIAYEQTGTQAATGETYLVEPCPDDQAWLQLRLLHHTWPAADEDAAGCFAPGILDDPLIEPWMEAGPHRLTLIRNGRVIHGGTR